MKRRNLKRRNRGQILVLFILSLVVLIGLAALGVDVGYWYSVRHELQRSADAGALAGASYFRDTGYWSDVAGDPQMAIAEARARAFASSDNVVTSPLDNNEIFVSFPENLKIRVGTQRTVPLFFSRLFLGPTKMIRAFAVAEAFPVTEKVTCVVPWGIPVPWGDTNGNGEYDAGDTPPQWPPMSDSQCKSLGTPTDWDYATHTIPLGMENTLRDANLCMGSQQILKIANTSTYMPGNFLGMDLSSIIDSCPADAPTIGPGANFYSYLINHSCDCKYTVNVGEEIPDVDSEPGNMVGPTVGPVAPTKYYDPNQVPGGQYYTNPPPEALPPGWHDINSMMNGDPTARWHSTTEGGYPDTDNPNYSWFDGQMNPGLGPWEDSPRIVRVPIYDPSGTIPDPDGNLGTYTPDKKGGRVTFKPLAFVGFLVEDIQYFPPNNGTVVGRFITVGGWGGGGQPGPATPVLNIRLVE
jgi:hypothetical protein